MWLWHAAALCMTTTWKQTFCREETFWQYFRGLLCALLYCLWYYWLPMPRRREEALPRRLHTHVTYVPSLLCVWWGWHFCIFEGPALKGCVHMSLRKLLVVKALEKQLAWGCCDSGIWWHFGKHGENLEAGLILLNILQKQCQNLWVTSLSGHMPGVEINVAW